MEPSARMECYGGETLTFAALLGPPGVPSCEPSYIVTPRWLDPCATQYLTTRAGLDGPVLAAHLHESAGSCNIGTHLPEVTCPYGHFAPTVTVEGHFDDPAATECVADDLVTIPGVPVPADVVYDCRLAFVLTAIHPQDVPLVGQPERPPAGPPPVAEGCEPSSAAGPTPVTADVAVGDWAEVIVDEVNLRQCPGVDALSYRRLSRGSAGLVVAGPVEADGYAWYALAAPGTAGWNCDAVLPPDGTLRQLTADEALLYCPNWFGWVASADTAGDPWLAAVDVECPPIPQSIEEVTAIQAGVRLACLGRETITFDAWLVGVGSGCETGAITAGGRPDGIAVTPEWLDPCSGQYLSAREVTQESGPQSFDPSSLPAHLHPDAGTCGRAIPGPGQTCPYDGLQGTVVTVEGHFDDPAAASCVAHDYSLYEIGIYSLYEIGILDQARVVYQCRIGFAVTAVRPQD